jgi:TonB-dependent siderophore receptor
VRRRIGHLHLLCALTAGLPAAAADEPAREEARESAPAEPSAKGSGAAAGASAVSTPVTVSVQGDLPYIPTSNTIATRLPLLLRLTPANVGIVNDVLIREQNDIVLGDALRNVSGVNAQTTFDVVDWFSIRGFDSLSSSLVLVDGAPEPEVTFYPLYNVERVEVLKGPAGFLYGSNPLAGAVNMVRRQPQGDDHLRGGVTAGSFNTYDATIDWNAASKDASHSFRLNGLWRQSDFYRDDMENDTVAVNPAYTWRPGADTTVNVNAEYVQSDFSPDSGLPLVNNEIPDVPRERSYQSPFDKSEQDLSRLQVDVDHRLGSHWSLRNKTYYRRLEWDSDGTLLGPTLPIPPDPQVFRTLAVLDDRQTFVGNQTEAILSASTGPVKHQVLMGVELGQYADKFTFDALALPPIGVFDPVETASQPLTPLPFQASAGDNRSVVAAPYVTDQIQFSEKWFALAGVRYDMIDFEEEGAFDPFTLEPLRVSRTDSDFSPMVGVVYSPTATLSFYANGATSFAPPAPRVLDEDRVPEESRQVEVGSKIEANGGKVRLTVAAYQMERENIGIPDDTGITQQVGDQESRGAELELAAEVHKGTRVMAAYAWNDSELTEFAEQVFFPAPAVIDRSGNTPAFAPRHLASLWVSQSLPAGFGVAGGGHYVSEQFIAEDNAFAIEPYVVYDAAVTWTKDAWDLSLNLKNVGGREYETRGFGSSSVIPAPTFGAWVGVRYAFQ